MKARKEITIAIVIGLLVGLVVVGGIIRARTALSNITPPEVSFNKKKAKPSPEPDTQDPFLTHTTEDNQVLSEDSLTLVGTTLADTYIVILGEKSEYIIVPSDTGHFSQDVALVTGANTITITSYETDGNSQEQTLNIVYTTAEI